MMVVGVVGLLGLRLIGWRTCFVCLVVFGLRMLVWSGVVCLMFVLVGLRLRVCMG